jgi:hypothetical protein
MYQNTLEADIVTLWGSGWDKAAYVLFGTLASPNHDAPAVIPNRFYTAPIRCCVKVVSDLQQEHHGKATEQNVRGLVPPGTP